jgi:hypothetical protein
MINLRGAARNRALMDRMFYPQMDFGLESSTEQKEELPWGNTEFRITNPYVEYTR